MSILIVFFESINHKINGIMLKDFNDFIYEVNLYLCLMDINMMF